MCTCQEAPGEWIQALVYSQPMRTTIPINIYFHYMSLARIYSGRISIVVIALDNDFFSYFINTRPKYWLRSFLMANSIFDIMTCWWNYALKYKWIYQFPQNIYIYSHIHVLTQCGAVVTMSVLSTILTKVPLELARESEVWLSFVRTSSDLHPLQCGMKLPI